MLSQIRFFLIFLFLGVGVAQAQDRGDRPWRLDLALTGNLFSGSFNQVQLLGRTFVSYSAKQAGNDLLVSGYRVWLQEEPGGVFERVGDETLVTDIPFYYVHPKIYLHGLGRFANSSSRLLDVRLNVGAGIGVTPVRTETILFRASLGGQFEYAHYDSAIFNLDVYHDGATRMLPRVAILSNGWYRVKNTPVSLRYVGEASMDPRDPMDNRQFLDTGLDIKLGASGWTAKVSALWTRDAVVPEGIEPAELKMGIGIGYVTPKATP